LWRIDAAPLAVHFFVTGNNIAIESVWWIGP
jgi:hypothetical protein